VRQGLFHQTEGDRKALSHFKEKIASNCEIVPLSLFGLLHLAFSQRPLLPTFDKGREKALLLRVEDESTKEDFRIGIY